MKDTDQNAQEKEKRSRSRSTSKSSKRSKSLSSSRSRSRSVSSDIDGYRLHIADIGDNVRKSELEKYFAQFGVLKELWMTNSSPCFGFAVYKEKKSASAALKEADGVEFGGQRIRVTNARPRTRGSGRRFFNPNMRCYQCGYSGHFYRDCPEVGNGGGGGGGGGGGDRRDSRYDRHSTKRRRERERDYYTDRDYGRRHNNNRRSSRRYEDYGSRRSGGRRRRY